MGCGCGGCGCACGSGLYDHHTPPALGAPVDPRPPRPIRRRTNINLAAPRASRCSTGPGGLYDAEPQARSNGAHSSWRSLKPRRDVRTSRHEKHRYDPHSSPCARFARGHISRYQIDRPTTVTTTSRRRSTELDWPQVPASWPLGSAARARHALGRWPLALLSHTPLSCGGNRRALIARTLASCCC
jgi:hypothetical protein